MNSTPGDLFAQLLRRCEDTIEKRSKHIAEDALTYARWILRDAVAMMTNLRETQERCTKLLEENRALKRELDNVRNR